MNKTLLRHSVAGHDDLMLGAVASVASRRFKREVGSARPGAAPSLDRWPAKGVGMRRADPVEIDVHRTLCGGPLGLWTPLDRFARAAPFTTPTGPARVTSTVV